MFGICIPSSANIGSTGGSTGTTGTTGQNNCGSIDGPWTNYNGFDSTTVEFFDDGGCLYDYRNPPLSTVGTCSYSYAGSSLTVTESPPYLDQNDGGFSPCTGPATFSASFGPDSKGNTCGHMLLSQASPSCPGSASLDGNGYFVCLPDSRQKAPFCGPVVGSCDQSAQNSTIKCTDYSGLNADLMATEICNSPAVYRHGVSCNQLFPNLLQQSACQMGDPTTSDCTTNWYSLGGCQDCTLCGQATCVAGPGHGGIGGADPGIVTCTDSLNFSGPTLSGECTVTAQAVPGLAISLTLQGTDDAGWVVSLGYGATDAGTWTPGTYSCTGSNCVFDAHVGNSFDCPAVKSTAVSVVITSADSYGNLAGTATANSICSDGGALTATLQFGY